MCTNVFLLRPNSIIYTRQFSHYFLPTCVSLPLALNIFPLQYSIDNYLYFLERAVYFKPIITWKGSFSRNYFLVSFFFVAHELAYYFSKSIIISIAICSWTVMVSYRWCLSIVCIYCEHVVNSSNISNVSLCWELWVSSSSMASTYMLLGGRGRGCAIQHPCVLCYTGRRVGGGRGGGLGRGLVMNLSVHTLFTLCHVITCSPQFQRSIDQLQQFRSILCRSKLSHDLSCVHFRYIYIYIYIMKWDYATTFLNITRESVTLFVNQFNF